MNHFLLTDFQYIFICDLIASSENSDRPHVIEMAEGTNIGSYLQHRAITLTSLIYHYTDPIDHNLVLIFAESKT